MKNLLFFISCLMLSSVAVAQTKAQKARIQEIREKYNDVMERMQLAQEEPNMDCSFHVTTHRNKPAIGIQEYKYDVFCNDESDFNEDTGEYEESVTPLFVRVRFNVAVREYSQEYLLGSDGNPVFVYVVGPDNPYGDETGDYEDAKFEQRLYFDDKGKFVYGYSQIRHADGKVVNVKELKSGTDDIKQVLSDCRSAIDAMQKIMP